MIWQREPDSDLQLYTSINEKKVLASEFYTRNPPTRYWTVVARAEFNWGILRNFAILAQAPTQKPVKINVALES